MDLEEGKNWGKYPIDLSQFLHMVQSVKHMQFFLTTKQYILFRQGSKEREQVHLRSWPMTIEQNIRCGLLWRMNIQLS